MALNDKAPKSVDYTSRDYYALKDALVTRVKERVNANGKQWNATDPADFGLALVEAFAHIGDVANYYIDRVANEAHLSTATQRQSILDIAKSYGYTPSGFVQSLVELTFTNSSTTTLLVPVNTVFSVSLVIQNAQNQVVVEELFSLTEDVSVPGAVDGIPGSSTAYATHGENVSEMPGNAADPGDNYDLAGELLGYSDGLATQTYVLKYPQVAQGSLQVFVRYGDTFSQWSEVDSLINSNPTDKVFTTLIDDQNFVKVIFGDNVSGAVPTLGATIKAQYVVGGGANGNMDSGKSFVIKSVPVVSGVTVLDLSPIVVGGGNASGGENPESNDSIRVNAPASFKAQTRAVVLDDFKQLAISTVGVGKAAAYADGPTTVALYIAPETSSTSADYFPGFDSTNTTVKNSWLTLSSDVTNSLSSNMQIGTTLNVLPPVYVLADTVVEYVKKKEYSFSSVTDSVNSGVVDGYGFYYLDFDQIIRPEKLEQSLSKIPGVESIKVLSLYRHGGSGINTLVPTMGEYFVFTSENVKAYPSASLVTLIPNHGTLSPMFQANVFSYTLTCSSSTITFTPTVVNSTSTITVNGSAVTSGAASSAITLSTGVNVVTIVVTSADGTVSNTYTIRVTH